MSSEREEDQMFPFFSENVDAVNVAERVGWWERAFSDLVISKAPC